MEQYIADDSNNSSYAQLVFAEIKVLEMLVFAIASILMSLEKSRSDRTSCDLVRLKLLCGQGKTLDHQIKCIIAF